MAWTYNSHANTYTLPITFNKVLSIVTGTTNCHIGSSSETNASQRFVCSVSATIASNTNSEITMKLNYENVWYGILIIGY